MVGDKNPRSQHGARHRKIRRNILGSLTTKNQDISHINDQSAHSAYSRGHSQMGGRLRADQANDRGNTIDNIHMWSDMQRREKDNALSMSADPQNATMPRGATFIKHSAAKGGKKDWVNLSLQDPMQLDESYNMVRNSAKFQKVSQSLQLNSIE